jgi:hypothetical protein
MDDNIPLGFPGQDNGEEGAAEQTAEDRVKAPLHVRMRAARTRTDHPDRNMVTGIYIGYICMAFCWSLSGQGTKGAAEERRRKSHAPPHARACTHALCARARTHRRRKSHAPLIHARARIRTDYPDRNMVTKARLKMPKSAGSESRKK